MTTKLVLVLGANGYIGNAAARAFVRAGWDVYGLVRSAGSSTALATEEIHPVVGSIDDASTHPAIRQALPATPDVIVSTTENTLDFIPHFNNILALLEVLSVPRRENSMLPLVIYTSGSKDYGIGPHYANDSTLKAIDEESPLRPPQFAAARVQNAPRIFEQPDIYDAVLVRPTNVYGKASSYYSVCFRTGERIAAATEDPSQRVLIAPTQPEWISHALHIDDCSDAYVSIASAPRELIRGEIFNISSESYESAADILEAMAAEYDIAGGIKYVNLDEISSTEDSSLAMAVGFPQLISSEKLRKATGWKSVRKSFSKGFHTYRLAYEASTKMKDENVARIGNTIKVLMSTVEDHNKG